MENKIDLQIKDSFLIAISAFIGALATKAFDISDSIRKAQGFWLGLFAFAFCFITILAVVLFILRSINK